MDALLETTGWRLRDAGRCAGCLQCFWREEGRRRLSTLWRSPLLPLRVTCGDARRGV